MMPMSTRYLEVTYRKGRPFAAYLYLDRREGDRATRTDRIDDTLLVDVSSDGRPIGIEILSPSAITVTALNAVLTRYKQPSLDADELRPLGQAA